MTPAIAMKKGKIMKEIWKTVKGHPSYEVSNTGKVRKNLSQSLDAEGYPRVSIDKRHMRVHQIEMETFCEKKHPTDMVNHIDGVKNNNLLSNLEYVSAKENSQKASQMGLMNPGHRKREIVVINLRTKEVKLYPSQLHVAKMLRITDSEVNKCLRGKRKSSHGYKFMYIEDWIKEAENTDLLYTTEDRQLSLFDKEQK